MLLIVAPLLPTALLFVVGFILWRNDQTPFFSIL